MHHKMLRYALPLALAVCALSPAARASDQALLIGVNQYKRLTPGHDLGGCVNDAQMMADCLKTKHGFSVTVLTEDAATKAGILAALAQMQKSVKPGDRVVVYFAGHGTVNEAGQTAILPSDADDKTDANDLRTDELYAAVRRLPALSKTIFLDSCHSGGMVRSLAGLRKNNKLVPRVYVRSSKTRNVGGQGEKAWQKTRVNGADNLSDTTKGGGVAYFTAALKTQVANETEIQGKRHGLFTFNLVNALLKGGKQAWSDVASQVTGKVAEATEGEQKPILGPGNFLKQVLFAALPGASSVAQTGSPSTPPITSPPVPETAPPTDPPTTGEATSEAAPPPAETAAPAPTSMTLDKIYNLSLPDPARLMLEMTPAVSPVTVGDTVRFHITAGMDGYVLLIGKDPAGKLSILYPEGANVNAAQVTKGTVLNLPEKSDEAFTADAPGTDGLKAILFTSKAAAEAMLKAFGGGTLGIGEANREWKKKIIPASDFYTSEIITQIAPKAN